MSNNMTRVDVIQGTLDLLILRALTLGPLHGWGISKRIREMSRDALEVNQGSRYPALRRLEYRQFDQATWGVSGEGRRAKFYSLTKHGRAKFAEERRRWQLFSVAVEHTLGAT
jgi:transcriptional regulator